MKWRKLSHPFLVDTSFSTLMKCNLILRWRLQLISFTKMLSKESSFVLLSCSRQRDFVSHACSSCCCTDTSTLEPHASYKTTGSNATRDTGHPGWRSSSFYSVTVGKFCFPFQIIIHQTPCWSGPNMHNNSPPACRWRYICTTNTRRETRTHVQRKLVRICGVMKE